MTSDVRTLGCGGGGCYKFVLGIAEVYVVVIGACMKSMQFREIENCVIIPSIYFFTQRSVYCQYRFSFPETVSLCLSDEGPMLETLVYVNILSVLACSTPIFLYFDLYIYFAYAAHYVHFFKVRLHTAINRADFVSWCMLIHVRR